MKKKFFAATMAGLMAMTAFTGCSSEEVAPDNGGATGGTTEPIEVVIPQLSGETEVVMWHFMSGAQEEILGEIITEFNETNGQGIVVSAISQGKVPDLNKKVIAGAQSNTLPAIINVYPDLATGLIEQDNIFDMSAFAMHPEIGIREDLEKDFIPAFVAEVAQWNDGQLYGLPMTKSTEVVYVNKTKLEEIGYTMEDVQNMTIEKLAEISAVSKEKLGIPGFGYDSNSNGFITIMKMGGMDFVELDGTINLDNEWAREYMTFLRAQVDSGAFRTTGEDGYLSGPFSNQQVLMYQGSSAGATFINTNDAFELAVVPAPSFESGSRQAVIQQGGSVFITNDVSPEQQYAAYEFVKFATNTENTAKFAVNTGYLPVRRSATETDTLKTVLGDTESVYGKVFPAAQISLEYAYYTPAINNAQSARNTIGEKFEAYLQGSIPDIESFISESAAEVQTAIGRQ